MLFRFIETSAIIDHYKPLLMGKQIEGENFAPVVDVVRSPADPIASKKFLEAYLKERDEHIALHATNHEYKRDNMIILVILEDKVNETITPP